MKLHLIVGILNDDRVLNGAGHLRSSVLADLQLNGDKMACFALLLHKRLLVDVNIVGLLK
jgi:hypothetical protein